MFVRSQRRESGGDTLTSQIAIDVQHGAYDDAVRHAEEIVTLYGTSGRLAQLADIETVAGRLGDAAAIATRMLTTTGQERADGFLALGRIDILKGSFSAARDALVLAEREGEPYSSQGPTLAAVHEQLGLAQVTRSEHDREAALENLERRASGRKDVYELERRLRAQHGTCPDLSALRKSVAKDPNWDGRMSLRIAAAAGCVPCAEVLSAGRNSDEADPRRLYPFGVCAESEGKLDLARDTFLTVARVKTATTDATAWTSTAHAVLAGLHLARVLAHLNQRDAARAAYEEFLTRWAHADRPLPEVDAARRELAALER